MSKSEEIIKELGLREHPEGGYFCEVHRSGSYPAKSTGFTDFETSSSLKQENCMNREIKNEHMERNDADTYESLTVAVGRENRRPDRAILRNCLTSIIWLQTRSRPTLKLGMNLSDIVNYYHGGNAFEYFLYNPVKRILRSEVLGPLIGSGQKLQVTCPGGWWKCGRMLDSEQFDYTLVGEAMGPGFDWYDFSWLNREHIAKIDDEKVHALLVIFIAEKTD